MFNFYTIIFLLFVTSICVLFSTFALYKNLNATKAKKDRIKNIISNDRLFVDENFSVDSIVNSNRDKSLFGKIIKYIFLYDSSVVFVEKSYVVRLLFGFLFGFLLLFSFLSVYIYSLHLLIFGILGGGILFRLIIARKYNAYTKKIINQLPDMLFMMARSLKIGVSLSKTFELIARQAPEPTKTLFSDLVRKIAVGKDFSEALDELAESVRVKEYTFFSIIIKLQSRTGGGLAEILDGFASNVRKRIMARKKAVALASEARMSCYVLSALPIFMAFIIAVLNPSYISVLYKTSSGMKLLYAAVGLFVIGVFSMIFVTKRTLR